MDISESSGKKTRVISGFVDLFLNLFAWFHDSRKCKKITNLNLSAWFSGFWWCNWLVRISFNFITFYQGSAFTPKKRAETVIIGIKQNSWVVKEQREYRGQQALTGAPSLTYINLSSLKIPSELISRNYLKWQMRF